MTRLFMQELRRIPNMPEYASICLNVPQYALA